MYFCRDQYRRAAFHFGSSISGKSDVADDLDAFYNPAEAARELIQTTSRLYQFSDILGCRDQVGQINNSC